MRLKEGRFYGELYGPYNDYTARQMDRQMVTERGDLWVHFTASYTDRITNRIMTSGLKLNFIKYDPSLIFFIPTFYYTILSLSRIFYTLPNQEHK